MCKYGEPALIGEGVDAPLLPFHTHDVRVGGNQHEKMAQGSEPWARSVIKEKETKEGKSLEALYPAEGREG